MTHTKKQTAQATADWQHAQIFLKVVCSEAHFLDEFQLSQQDSVLFLDTLYARQQ